MNNTGIGEQVLNYVTTGSNNIAVGSTAGAGVITGSNNTFLGYNTSASFDCSDSTAIGNGAVIDQSDQITLGTIGTATYIAGSMRMHVDVISEIVDTTYTLATLPGLILVTIISGTIVITLPETAPDGTYVTIRRTGGTTLGVPSITINAGGVLTNMMAAMTNTAATSLAMNSVSTLSTYSRNLVYSEVIACWVQI
jgi:hypothetical protein